MHLATVLLSLTLLGSFYALYNETQSLAAQGKLLQTKKSELEKLTATLQERDTLIKTLQLQVAANEKKIQGLSQQNEVENNGLRSLEANLLSQRIRVEQKRKEYQDLLANPKGVDQAISARISFLNDDVKLLEQRLKSVNQDLSNTGLDAADARQKNKNDAAWRMAQIQNQIQYVEDGLKQLRAQRASYSKQDIKAGRTQTLDAQIAAANVNLSDLQNSAAQTRNEQSNATQTLETQIKKSLSDLKQEQNENNRKIGADKDELYKLQQHNLAAGSFQKERDALIKKLAAELQEETEKLKTLETQVRLQKAQNSIPPGQPTQTH